ncbi:hypothetical protein [Acetobacter ascendens]|uniref:hypothetical protein n=1 Tax=Acetobacter ascendens TaxID=481146 RepID=UPI000875D47B|nr:hypothetical protein [Acetobacter ascendens]AOW50770.1 hypothetical protein A4R89_14995 [Acetobacter ascendens]
MTTKKTSRTKKPVVSKAPEDPARHRYTEEEMDALIDKAWPEEKVEAYFRAEREDAPIPVVHDFAVMRPQTARLAKALADMFPGQFKGVEIGAWPPINAEDGMIDVIYLGESWIVQLGYDGYEPSRLGFVNATCDGLDYEEALEIDCGLYQQEGFDTYEAAFPLTDEDREEFIDYMQRNFNRPAEKVILVREDDREADQANGDKVVPFRKPS